MQYELQIFDYEGQQELRSVQIDGKPWFVLADVCRAIELQAKNGSFWHHTERLDEDEVRTVSREQVQQATSPHKGEVGTRAHSGGALLVVNESGMYSLILTSKKPAARKFKKWITSEVLPSIRQTGSYGTVEGAVSAEWQPFHDRVSAAWGAVPDGYFSIFKEVADLTVKLISNGVPVNHHTIPDISMGQMWGKHWTDQGFDNEYGPRVSYMHNYPSSYPQSQSNPQPALCYPEDALSAFRRWLRGTYIPQCLPGYLLRKEKKGELSGPTMNAALAALGVVPTPKRLGGTR